MFCGLCFRARYGIQQRCHFEWGQPKSGSYPAAGNPWTGLGGPMIGAIRSLM
jgi:hypothetical protein